MHQRELTPEVLTFIESCNVRELKALAKVPDRDNPLYTLMTRSYTLMLCLYRRLSRILEDTQAGYRLYTDESLVLVRQRWRRLCTKFYSATTKRFRVSTVCTYCTPMHSNARQYTPIHCTVLQSMS
jgi:hypothetical protein